ncbi:flagellar assembly peptidoglycan hydrolase FlgJ [Massilia glaciei]|uniref:Peptidoglycan hydrolase FlgJ n=1 Tax=Massilia glaciei TaxID=1524097 RepID=A0A2U2HGN9_9BURK|nr:flagellar assembly peptidoglycan hydrolase FlgJ [Massilia glaciei]PWF44350.1 flagellar assembly peptidoglycan hydrolase FlgJ [Massilia glaciei]
MDSLKHDLSSRLAFDSQGLGALKASAKAGSPDALKAASTQFEAMFINMMMKSMRAATPQDGMFDSEQSKMFTSMLDQQTSENLAKRGVGLADVLIRQLSSQALGGRDVGPGEGGSVAQGRGMPQQFLAEPVNAQALAIGGDSVKQPGAGVPYTDVFKMHPIIKDALAGVLPAAPAGPAWSAAQLQDGPRLASQQEHVRAFQNKLGGHAEEASRVSGIPAKFMLGQAALESGWGKREIQNADGSASHNLFGIKAGPGWKGRVATATTTEYVNGVPQTRVERFRAYDSYADSFNDFARMISTNPRYEKVLAAAGDASSFAHGLQKAGYATDPRYGEKLSRIIRQSLG